jgi:protein O-GlcNAc transferase
VSRPLTISGAFELARDLAQSGSLQDAATVCSKILEAEPAHAQTLHLLALVSYRQGDPAAAARLLRKAAAGAPPFAPAFNDLGNILAQQGRTSEAIEQYRRAIAVAPEYAEAHNNLGNACQIAGEFENAVEAYRRALALRPGYAEAHRNMGSALRRLGRLGEAVEAFRTAVSLNPDYADAITQLVQELRSQCYWALLKPLTAQLIGIVEAGSAAVNPFVFLSLDTTARQQFLCARRWAAGHVEAGASKLPPPPASPRPDGRITMGYLSADFQEHATAQLTAALFELHDRNRFRVIGYSYGADDGSAMRRRLARAFDEFVDLESVSHADAAARIRADQVDILVDLKGYTTDARPQILALRPAPLQVSYLGYPGTMGTEAVDFILADPFVLPAGQQEFYSEKIVHLPGCYQANDNSRPVASPGPSRAACGLPERAFVFCCFNGSEKLTADVFDVWIRLLAAVPEAVLWLLASNPAAVGNLRREAEARLPGTAARLVFAPRLPNPQHLARFALADLFLDTFPYNAHTLASDALWGGCPVLTRAGETFPSRVAGSLLRAAGMPELIATSLEDYESLAVRLARAPAELAGLRARLQSTRLSAPLFDSAGFTRRIEAVYESIWSGGHGKLASDE